ncbi:hypothetical protein G7B40_014815 [Aetokthonos hydrillicola Thurmond2011]|uniref:Uncharacterized protein n=1 Tax=Aetokthonos hydrillicola Thurmond2011 TaxID=2712845 RepID=A0AAP5I6V5_9CYAN|nr:hypothetical protein [Aetokthonos hydrillicola]MBO3461381.1 hypothetical protein [Aetokthonos hydrillicola CCALA 1050]MBW4586817.1 hypothetical protein [Aetokthonos hydrillicola CCALA 1050]MDR9895825.1 hypothetical protein [Aetokthonos hydrillicola Thurmond2011]
MIRSRERLKVAYVLLSHESKIPTAMKEQIKPTPRTGNTAKPTAFGVIRLLPSSFR